jgi:hypothetical protein
VWWILGIAAVADVVLLLPLGPIEPPLVLHHLEHGALLLIGGAFALRGTPKSPERTGTATGASVLWLVAALLLSLLSLVGMVPDLYDYVDAHPLAHAGQHVAFIAVGYLSVFTARRYAPALGPLWLAAYAVMTFVAVTGFGVAAPS